MARSLMVLRYSGNCADALNRINSILTYNGYSYVYYGSGELVWQNGDGTKTAMKFVKVEFSQYEIRVYAWIVVGKMMSRGKEQDLRGIIAAIPKSSLLKLLSSIKDQIY